MGSFNPPTAGKADATHHPSRGTFRSLAFNPPTAGKADATPQAETLAVSRLGVSFWQSWPNKGEDHLCDEFLLLD
jgi:hypothetical protein